MQSTHSEFRASPYAGTGCADCHAPMVDNREPSSGPGQHRSHTFVASRDTALLRSAVSISAARDGNRVNVHIQPLGLGHAFPTGDLFRRLSVTAEVVGVEEQVLAEASRMLSRHFAIDPQTRVKIQKSDDRVVPDRPSQVTLELGPQAVGRAIRWRVAYERVEHPTTVENESTALVEGEVVLAEGTLQGK